MFDMAFGRWLLTSNGFPFSAENCSRRIRVSSWIFASKLIFPMPKSRRQLMVNFLCSCHTSPSVKTIPAKKQKYLSHENNSNKEIKKYFSLWVSWADLLSLKGISNFIQSDPMSVWNAESKYLRFGCTLSNRKSTPHKTAKTVNSAKSFFSKISNSWSTLVRSKHRRNKHKTTLETHLFLHHKGSHPNCFETHSSSKTCLCSELRNFCTFAGRTLRLWRWFVCFSVHTLEIDHISLLVNCFFRFLLLTIMKKCDLITHPNFTTTNLPKISLRIQNNTTIFCAFLSFVFEWKKHCPFAWFLFRIQWRFIVGQRTLWVILALKKWSQLRSVTLTLCQFD